MCVCVCAYVVQEENGRTEKAMVFFFNIFFGQLSDLLTTFYWIITPLFIGLILY